MKERPDAEIRRLGVFAILALLVFAAAPGLRLLAGAGPAAAWSAELGRQSPAKAGPVSLGGDTILRRVPGHAAPKGDRAPGAPAAGLAATVDLPPSARMAIRSRVPARPLAGDRPSPPYQPRAPPVA